MIGLDLMSLASNGWTFIWLGLKSFASNGLVFGGLDWIWLGWIWLNVIALDLIRCDSNRLVLIGLDSPHSQVNSQLQVTSLYQVQMMVFGHTLQHFPHSLHGYKMPQG